MHRITRTTLALVTVSVGLSCLTLRPTQAYPRFLKKENLTSCGYCHVKEDGGGARNYRGQFYQKHDNSFASFDDVAEAKAAGVEVAPHEDMKPLSQTPPTASASPTGSATPVKSPLDIAGEKAHAAMTAYDIDPKDDKLKAAYVTALASFAHATLINKDTPAAKRNDDTIALCRKALAMDPKNASAKADLKAAESAKADLKAIEDAKTPVSKPDKS